LEVIMFKKIMLFVLINIFFSFYAGTACAMTSAELQTAINNCPDGGIVNVPAGSHTWSSMVTISGKTITLRGAGIGNTIISDATASSATVPLIKMTTNSRITGFTFLNPNNGGVAWVTGTYPNFPNAFRIDNCYFNVTTGSKVVCVEVEPGAYGVVDHCTFYDASVRNVGQITSSPTGTVGQAQWAAPLNLGTAEAFYVEDCTFTSTEKDRNAMDSRQGAKWVFRYNTIHNFYLEAHSGFFAGTRGTRSWEVYKNTFTGNLNTYVLASLRSGTGVVWGNTSTGTRGAHVFQIDDSRAGLDTRGVGIYAESTGDQWCIEGTATEYDDPPGSTGGDGDHSGYPCRDQIGRSGGATITSPQELSPVMEWDNWRDGSTDIDLLVNPAYTAPSHAVAIKANRDYYDDVVTGNSETGFVHAATGFNYRPFTYPHPLVQTPNTTTADVTKPAPPTNFGIKTQ
jgi:hypothetical protein